MSVAPLRLNICYKFRTKVDKACSLEKTSCKKMTLCYIPENYYNKRHVLNQ